MTDFLTPIKYETMIYEDLIEQIKNNEIDLVILSPDHTKAFVPNKTGGLPFAINITNNQELINILLNHNVLFRTRPSKTKDFWFSIVGTSSVLLIPWLGNFIIFESVKNFSGNKLKNLGKSDVAKLSSKQLLLNKNTNKQNHQKSSDNHINSSFFLQNKSMNTENVEGFSVEFTEETQHNNSKISFDLKYFLDNFNQGNKQFFETESCFYYLKPTDNVIHGLAGNLGINNEAELEIVETSQASYLSFEAEEKLWLIPNFKLSRWQRLLKNSAFFDVLGDSSKPMLVKPAQLELVSDDRRKLIAKGIFN